MTCLIGGEKRVITCLNPLLASECFGVIATVCVCVLVCTANTHVCAHFDTETLGLERSLIFPLNTWPPMHPFSPTKVQNTRKKGRTVIMWANTRVCCRLLSFYIWGRSHSKLIGRTRPRVHCLSQQTLHTVTARDCMSAEGCVLGISYQPLATQPHTLSPGEST